MGKRLMINADTWVTPAYVRPNYAGEKGFLKFNYILEPSIELAIAEKSTIGVGYLNTKGRFPVFPYAVGQVEIFSGGHTVYKSFYITNVITDNTFNSHGVGIFFKQYIGEQSFAHLGHFVKAELDCFFYSYEIDEINIADYITSPPANYSGVLFPQTKANGSVLGFKVEIGHDFLFFSRLKLSTGLSFGLTFKGMDMSPMKTTVKEEYKYLFSFNDVYKDMVTPPINNVNGQILGMYWFGLRMGVGFLAF
jgi:hypothetical protein